MRIFFDAVNGELAPRVTHLHRCMIRTRRSEMSGGSQSVIITDFPSLTKDNQ